MSTRTLKPGPLSESSAVVLCSMAIAATKLRPKPLPGVERLSSSLKKRWNTLVRAASGTPGPSSDISTTAAWPLRAALNMSKIASTSVTVPSRKVSNASTPRARCRAASSR